MKFKIGDKVRPISDLGGYFKIKGKRLTTNNILNISAVNEGGEYGITHGFKEDTNGDGRAHWLRVEENFELAHINWRDLL